jgi:hypothetical protein
MAEAEGIPPTASVASVGPGIRYIGKNHCYAYSGVITDTGSGSAAATALDFTTGGGYIRARVTILSDETGGAGLYTKIELNGLNVFRLNIDSSSSAGVQFDNPFYMLIPPFTRFHLYVGANATVDFTAMISGRVYGVG